MKRSVAILVCGLALLLPLGTEAATTGTVTGQVTPIEWAQEVEVCVIESQPGEICTTPEASGFYSLANVPFGGVQIEFLPSYRSRLLKQYYRNASRLSEATTIILSPMGLVANGVNANLSEGGAIKGTVTAAPGGEPLSEVEVCAVSIGAPVLKSCARSDGTGNYELHSLRTATYDVRFRGVAGSAAAYQPAEHPPVAVGAGATTSGIDASLARGAQIGGIVTAAEDGSRLAGISVCVFAAASPKPLRCEYSDQEGEYSFEGLPDGSYQVGFSLLAAEIDGESLRVEDDESLQVEDDGFESQYYEGTAIRAVATTISVLAPAKVSGVNAALIKPPEPLVPAPAPIGVATVVATPIVTEPRNAPKKSCKKGTRKKKVHGKVRCVRPAVHKRKSRTPNKSGKH